MTYAERIERVARALCGVMRAFDGECKACRTARYAGDEPVDLPNGCLGLGFLTEARAADAAVLEAIQKPTPEMEAAALNAYHETSGSIYPIDIYKAAYAAIPRREEGS